ncbi:hypothetical protein SAMN05444064_10784 [Pseudomonas syringae]|uniref:hypothetical protein n=1 Tax=Pseudomonas syringae TaxID=317 RepID=UPI000896586E|nr:hypothetical protein [Pseudomonas syringae]SDW82418.1 hypothetical protein SAMN05444514_107155 [Pseudomonas syringae]SFL99076.1 hypothetical protein SAMN05444064_10784 [Pseudomonas syringae]
MISNRKELFGKTINSSGLFWLAALCFLVAASLGLPGHYIGLAGMFAAVAIVVRGPRDDGRDEISCS